VPSPAKGKDPEPVIWRTDARRWTAARAPDLVPEALRHCLRSRRSAAAQAELAMWVALMYRGGSLVLLPDVVLGTVRFLGSSG
jgi:hypothetical protein